VDKSTSNSQEKRYAAISIAIPLMNNPKRPTPRGDVDQPNVEGINPQRMRMKKMKNMWKMNLLHLRRVHK
jgi:hypothetical protein